MIEPRPEVRALADAMERKLRFNDHKGGWQGCSTRYLFRRLGQEVRELGKALDKGPIPSGTAGAVVAEHIVSEAADVANYAMMVADVVGALRPEPAAPQASPEVALVREIAAILDAAGAPPALLLTERLRGALAAAAVPRRTRLQDDRPAQMTTLRMLTADGEVDIYVTVGLYPDGRPGELFLKAERQGSLLSGFADALAISVSLGLQYGVPLGAYVAKFRRMLFAPFGRTRDGQVVHSVLDLLAAHLERAFPEPNGTPLAVASKRPACGGGCWHRGYATTTGCDCNCAECRPEATK